MTVSTAPAIGPRWEWGDRLRKIRRDIARVSQAEMAALVGVKTPTYAAWEGGRNEPLYRVAVDVAHAIESAFPGEVTAAWILGASPLPRMDSNHQPPDWRSHPPKLLALSHSPTPPLL